MNDFNHHLVKINHCPCGHRPSLFKRYRSYGVITGTKYWWYIQCRYCKRKTRKFYHWNDQKAITLALQAWDKIRSNHKPE